MEDHTASPRKHAVPVCMFSPKTVKYELAAADCDGRPRITGATIEWNCTSVSTRASWSWMAWKPGCRAGLMTVRSSGKTFSVRAGVSSKKTPKIGDGENPVPRTTTASPPSVSPASG